MFGGITPRPKALQKGTFGAGGDGSEHLCNRRSGGTDAQSVTPTRRNRLSRAKIGGG